MMVTFFRNSDEHVYKSCTLHTYINMVGNVILINNASKQLRRITSNEMFKIHQDHFIRSVGFIKYDLTLSSQFRPVHLGPRRLAGAPDNDNKELWDHGGWELELSILPCGLPIPGLFIFLPRSFPNCKQLSCLASFPRQHLTDLGYTYQLIRIYDTVKISLLLYRSQIRRRERE